MDWFEVMDAQIISKVVYIEKDDSGKWTAKPVYTPDSPYREFFKRMRDFYSKGYIRKDVLTAAGTSAEFGKPGGYILTLHNADDFTEQQETIKYGIPIKIVKTGSKVTTPGKPSDTNSVIPSSAKYPENAMQLYELINSQEGKELYNMLVYGLEGKQYTKVSDNQIEVNEDAKYKIEPWVVGNTFNAYETQNTVPGYNDYILNVLHNPDNIYVPEQNELTDFKFDSNPVKGYMVQIENALASYDGLRYGVYEDWEAKCGELEQKLAASGVDDVVKEVQKQIDEYVGK